MQIKRLQLQSFKQFTNATIELRSNLSLVVGGNNSGKSSVLQSLATWQFCKTLLEIEKGRESWTAGKTTKGVGMGIVDFTPMNVPSLNHLWTNLKSAKGDNADGYTLKIGVFWDSPSGEKHLEIGLALANDRLFIKTTSSNLTVEEVEDEKFVPRVAYLPPFAGITDRESRLTPAMRGRLIGQGLSGGVIRNALFDLHTTNEKKRKGLRTGKRIVKGDEDKWAELYNTDPWEILQHTLRDVFETELSIVPFNEQYHSFIRVECLKGKITPTGFTPHPDFTARDIMVEGSGFLQWLSVYTLALSPEIDVILLDEPDAHLHPTLQQVLVSRLRGIGTQKDKQILMATHSPELIRSYDFDQIMAIEGRKSRYLGTDDAKIGVLAGIGSAHSPTLDALMRHKRMLIIEGESDLRLLKKFAERLGKAWPPQLVPWLWTGKVEERRKLFLQLREHIKGLRAVSIRDRDDEQDGSTTQSLEDKSYVCKDPEFIPLKWRRRHIENYLLNTAAIARAAGKTPEEVNAFFGTHSLVIPPDPNPSDVVIAIRDARGKELFKEDSNSIERAFGITRDDIVKDLLDTEVPEDIWTFLQAITDLCSDAPASVPTPRPLVQAPAAPRNSAASVPQPRPAAPSPTPAPTADGPSPA